MQRFKKMESSRSLTLERSLGLQELNVLASQCSNGKSARARPAIGAGCGRPCRRAGVLAMLTARRSRPVAPTSAPGASCRGTAPRAARPCAAQRSPSGRRAGARPGAAGRRWAPAVASRCQAPGPSADCRCGCVRSRAGAARCCARPCTHALSAATARLARRLVRCSASERHCASFVCAGLPVCNEAARWRDGRMCGVCNSSCAASSRKRKLQAVRSGPPAAHALARLAAGRACFCHDRGRSCPRPPSCPLCSARERHLCASSVQFCVICVQNVCPALGRGGRG